MRYSTLDWIAFALVIIGAINWGLVGAFDFNLVTEIFGANSAISSIVFIAVGIAGLYTLFSLSMSAYDRGPGDAV